MHPGTVGMAISAVHLPMRKLFLKRRRTFLVLAIVLCFIGYFIFFAGPFVKQISFTDVSAACVCETSQNKSSNVGVVSSSEQEVDTQAPIDSLNVHMWSELCGKDIDVLRNSPHFPYYPNKRSFMLLFRNFVKLNFLTAALKHGIRKRKRNNGNGNGNAIRNL